MLEKSIVFVSESLGLLTSAVLGMYNLLRPFTWPHVVVPVVPMSLFEVLEAPIPILIGIQSNRPLKIRSLVFVLLDEKDPNKQVRHNNLLRDIPEPFADNMKQKMSHLYAKIYRK